MQDQHRIVSRVQLLAAGWSDADIRRSLRGRRWRTVHPGVDATHTGPIGYDEQRLAALLYAGPEAASSHYTAAEQFGLIKRDDRRPVYLAIPWRRRVRPRPNIVIARDRHWETRLAAVVPPDPTQQAVLDIVGISRSLDDAAAMVAEACQSGRVSADQIRAHLWTGGSASRCRAGAILADVAAGSHSLLECVTYERERAHALPSGLRQRAVDYLSMSPTTKNMLPRMATMSATTQPGSSAGSTGDVVEAGRAELEPPRGLVAAGDQVVAVDAERVLGPGVGVALRDLEDLRQPHVDRARRASTTACRCRRRPGRVRPSPARAAPRTGRSSRRRTG